MADLDVASLDAGWAACVRTAAATTQDSWLEEADACRRSGDPEDARRALATYRALTDRLASGGPDDLERAGWVLREDGARDEVVRRVALSTLRNGSSDDRLWAEMILGECDLCEARVAPAEQALRRLAPRVRGRGDDLELRTCHALSWTFALGRKEVEALVLARRAQQIAEQRPDLHPLRQADAAISLLDAYMTLSDTVRARPLIDALRVIAGRLTEPASSQARRYAEFAAVDAALEVGDLDAARAALAAASHADLARDTGVQIRGLRIALASGDEAEARLRVVQAGGRVSADPLFGLEWDLLEIELAVRFDGPEGVVRAQAFLDRMDDATRETKIGTGARLRWAGALGDLLSKHAKDPDAAGRAYRAAADAAFDRVFELERCARDLPGLSAAPPDDRAALAEYRTRFVHLHQKVLDLLCEQLTDSARRGALPAWASAAVGGMAVACAWCKSVRDTDGTWLPLGHFVPTSGALEVTHGVCESCGEQLMAEIAGTTRRESRISGSVTKSSSR